MKKEEYKEEIDNLIKSDEFIELKKYYERETIFDILEITTNENIHSNFLKWIFDSKSSHLLDDEPLKKLLSLLIEKDKRLNEYINKDVISNIQVTREKATSDKTGFIDLFIKFDIKLNDGNFKSINVIIENKIYSGINGEMNSKEINKIIDKKEINKTKNQLDKYISYAEEIEKESNNRVILVFLCPENNIPIIFNNKEGDNRYKNKYILITYEDLLEKILEVCYKYASSEKEGKIYIGDYIQSLNKITITSSEKEKSYIKSICDSYIKELNYILISILKLFDKFKKTNEDFIKYTGIIHYPEIINYACSVYSDNIQVLKPIFKYLAKESSYKEFSKENLRNFKSIDNIQRCNKIKKIKGDNDIEKNDTLLNNKELIKKIVENIDKLSSKEQSEIKYYTGRLTPLVLENNDQYDKVPEGKKGWYEKIEHDKNKYVLTACLGDEAKKFIKFLNEKFLFKIERYR